MKRKDIILIVLSAIGLYLLSTGVSYAVFNRLAPLPVKEVKYTPPLSKKSDGVSETITFDETLPKTETCLLTGELFSKPQREWWETHRPLGVMIENHQESRPQSGLSRADVVYELVAEGGITRFLAIFFCQDAGIIGPVRSARTYFVDFISEYGNFPLYAHVGGANVPGPANALGQIEDYGWASYNDLNQFSIGFPTFWRDYELIGHPVATEHTMYSTTQKLWKVAESRGLTGSDKKGKRWDEKFKPWKFKDDTGPSQRGDIKTIEFTFWKGYGEYTVSWVYDTTENVYKRENGGQAHTDLNNKEQLTAKNVVIVFMQERSLNDDEKHLLYGTKGKGQAMVFLDGKEIRGTWERGDREDRMIIRDSKGEEVQFNRGPIWIEVLSIGTKVSS